MYSKHIGIPKMKITADKQMIYTFIYLLGCNKIIQEVQNSKEKRIIFNYFSTTNMLKEIIFLQKLI